MCKKFLVKLLLILFIPISCSTNIEILKKNNPTIFNYIIGEWFLYSHDNLDHQLDLRFYNDGRVSTTKNKNNFWGKWEVFNIDKNKFDIYINWNGASFIKKIQIDLSLNYKSLSSFKIALAGESNYKLIYTKDPNAISKLTQLLKIKDNDERKKIKKEKEDKINNLNKEYKKLIDEIRQTINLDFETLYYSNYLYTKWLILKKSGKDIKAERAQELLDSKLYNLFKTGTIVEFNKKCLKKISNNVFKFDNLSDYIEKINFSYGDLLKSKLNEFNNKNKFEDDGIDILNRVTISLKFCFYEKNKNFDTILINSKDFTSKEIAERFQDNMM